MATGDEQLYANNENYDISIKFFPDRDKMRVAMKTSQGTYYFDSVTNLTSVVDILDWFEVFISMDTVGQNERFWINDIDVMGVVGAQPPNGTIAHDTSTKVTVGGTSQNTLFDENLQGAIQELWVADQYIDFSMQSSRDAFTDPLTGVPKMLGTDGLAAGVTPYVYIRGQYGQDYLQNKGSGGGAFSEEGSIFESDAYPIRPGGMPPTGSTPDDTYAYVRALLGVQKTVPPSGYGIEQERQAPTDGEQFIAIGSTLLHQNLTSPISAKPLTIFSTTLSSSAGLAGGLFKTTDPYDRTYSEVAHAINTEVDSFVVDGSLIHNGDTALRVLPRRGHSIINEPTPADDPDDYDPEEPDLPPSDDIVADQYSLNTYNSRFSYLRRYAAINSEFMSMSFEDCLFDGIYGFMQCQNAASTEDQANRVVTIRNSLIWLRRLPYPQHHLTGSGLGTDPKNTTNANIWGHGTLFDWHGNGPTVQIHDCIFYIENYGALDEDYTNWISGAQSTIGFLADTPSRLGSCSNNKVIFGHPTDTYQADPWIPITQRANFTVTNYSQDSTAPQEFFDARNTWLLEHRQIDTVGESLFDSSIDYGSSGIQPYVPYPTF